jgi:glycosyltransferase involved in cell wall biosynthesis
MKWICCQLGAREHYAIPRALFRLDMLASLVTDAWVLPSSLLAKICGRRSKLRDRFHDELLDARVTGFNSSLILFETLTRARDLSEWEKIIARNRWFERKVVSSLTSDPRALISAAPVLLSYSYAALEPFRYAESQGWKKVLVQIDPGPEEERILAEEVARVPELAGGWRPAPAEYWAAWREECDHADRIVVNSEWSREGLIRSGVPSGKLAVIPLAYEPGAGSGRLTEPRLQRRYPEHFTQERPLRVLFLGQVNLRKGVARLLAAARILHGEPVEFWIVGPVQIANARTIADNARVKWFGPATRKQVAEMYRNADVFILPTLSDGFAITQLEAQAYGLPLIVSRHCGDVVQDNVNGLLLDEPSVEAIESAIRFCLERPSELARFFRYAIATDEFSISRLGERLTRLTDAGS